MNYRVGSYQCQQFAQDIYDLYADNQGLNQFIQSVVYSLSFLVTLIIIFMPVATSPLTVKFGGCVVVFVGASYCAPTANIRKIGVLSFIMFAAVLFAFFLKLLV